MAVGWKISSQVWRREVRRTWVLCLFHFSNPFHNCIHAAEQKIITNKLLKLFSYHFWDFSNLARTCVMNQNNTIEKNFHVALHVYHENKVVLTFSQLFIHVHSLYLKICRQTYTSQMEVIKQHSCGTVYYAVQGGWAVPFQVALSVFIIISCTKWKLHFTLFTNVNLKTLGWMQGFSNEGASGRNISSLWTDYNVSNYR